MKRTSSNLQEGGTQTKRRRHLSGSEDEDSKYLLRQITEPPMSKIYNSSFRNNKPAELFRKDLISAMKMADSEQLMPEDYWTMVDPWKQEWEKGVQVPVNPDGLPSPSFRKVNKSKLGDFKMPKKLIRCTNDEFFSDDLHVPTDVALQAEKVCRYDLDDLDFQWLCLLNEERDDLGLAPIGESEMELILEEFESQCGNSLQEAIRNQEGLGIEFDEDVICDVCRSPDSEDGNEMVFCDSCNICVHQACYGITTIPEGSWVCRTCALGIRPPCVLCPNRGGAMKSTRSGQKWAHVSCALWVPEVSIGCVDKMEPITKICHIPASRWALVCSICRERNGACIQCSFKTCKTAYHITCAFKEGLEMKAIIDEENEEDGVKLRSFCDKHGKKKNDGYGPEDCEATPRNGERGRRELEMSSEEKAGVRSQRIRVLEAEFYCYVNTKGTSDLLQLDANVVDFVYHYWKLKRKANFDKALLMPRAEESDLLIKQQEDSLYARMKMFVHLRQDLERVRNLCYMVNRREKLSRSLFKIREDVFRKQEALLNARGAHNLNAKEREAALQANRGENIYDCLYTDKQTKIPSLQSVISILEGKDGPSVDVYSPRKTPKKTAEVHHRLPNPYAKHYLNGIRRSHRRFASLFKFEDSENVDCVAAEETGKRNLDGEDEQQQQQGYLRESDVKSSEVETNAIPDWTKAEVKTESDVTQSDGTSLWKTPKKTPDSSTNYKKNCVLYASGLVLKSDSDESAGMKLRSGDKGGQETSDDAESGRRSLGGASQRGPLCGYKIPKRVRVEGTCNNERDRHVPVSPLSSVAHEPYLKTGYHVESPRLVIKLRKEPDSQSERWRGDNSSTFQVVRNDWDSPHRRSERRRKPFVYDNGNRYRFRTELHRPEFFS